MNKYIISSVVTLAISGGSYAQTDTKPNILFIMADDHAEQAISAYGHAIGKVAPTPNIDRIAHDGALFLNNYCCNSISGPSRAAILTGKHSHKNGFMQNGSKGFDGSQQTLPKILHKNGYQTAIIGKWHLLTTPTGFDHWDILRDQGDYYNPEFISSTDSGRVEGYVTELITQKTEQWLDHRDKSKPFFLMMHHKAAHRNWEPALKYLHLYEKVSFPVPVTFFDHYDTRKAAAKQQMNIYRNMYEGHDLKMVAGIDSKDYLYDPWPEASFGCMNPNERKAFWEAYRDRNNAFYHKRWTNKDKALWKYQRYIQDYMAVVKSLDDSVGEMKCHCL